MSENELKQNRIFEIKKYCQSWFWQENEKSELLTKLLEKIYNLEDVIKTLKEK